MTQSDVCATGFRHRKEDFNVTDVMRERFEDRRTKYVETITQMWADQGEDPGSEEWAVALDYVNRSSLVPERSDWMHPLDALAFVTSMPEGAGLGPEDQLEYRDALRTIWSLSPKEYRKLVADSAGITSQSVWNQYERHVVRGVVEKDQYRSRLPTAMYRKYDSDGTLLYVGISMDPKHRDTVHGVLSPWAKYVERTEIEWLPDRASALEAETIAIRDEDPIFNVSKSRHPDPHIRQVDYFRSR